MLEALSALFATSGIGALIGLGGGALNRWMDFKTRKLDLEVEKQRQAHELALRAEDRATMQLEIDGRMKVAEIERDAVIETAAYGALSKAQEMDRATYGGGFVDCVRGLIRPLITILFVALVFWINWAVMGELRARPVDADLVKDVIQWILLQASVCIGYWFGSRPSSSKK